MKSVHPGRLLRREMQARNLSANALALALRVNSAAASPTSSTDDSVGVPGVRQRGRWSSSLRRRVVPLLEFADHTSGSRRGGARRGSPPEVAPADRS